MICEGPTDCAALLDLGFDVLGRPSCSGGIDIVRSYLAGKRADVVIVADHDNDKVNPQGVTFNPGIDGALQLAKGLRGVAWSVKIIVPLGKDVREWVGRGATRVAFESLIRNARPCNIT